METISEQKRHGKHIENIDLCWSEHKNCKPKSNSSIENYESKITYVLGKSPVGKASCGKNASDFFKQDDLVFHKQKRLSEYCDLVNLYSPNVDKKYRQNLLKAPTIFHIKSGRFTQYFLGKMIFK